MYTVIIYKGDTRAYPYLFPLCLRTVSTKTEVDHLVSHPSPGQSLLRQQDPTGKTLGGDQNL